MVAAVKARIAAAALALSASAFVALVASEGFTGRAVVPTQGDRPTVGFGSTFRDDGTPVQLGDTITAPQALARTLAHIEKDEGALRHCVTAPLHQVEYDLLVDFAYQYGAKTTCASSMVRLVNAGQYAQACGAYLRYRFAAGYDCSTPGNTRCRGVWARQLDRYLACMAAQT